MLHRPLSQIIPYCAPNMSLHPARGLWSFCFHSLHNRIHGYCEYSNLGFLCIHLWHFSEGGRKKKKVFSLWGCLNTFALLCLYIYSMPAVIFWYLSSGRRDSGYKWWYFWAVSDRQACVNDKDRIVSLLPPFLFSPLDSESLSCWWSCTHTVRPPKGGHLQLGRSPETNIWFL